MSTLLLLEAVRVAVPVRMIDPPQMRCGYQPAPGLPNETYAEVRVMNVARDNRARIWYVWREGDPSHAVVFTFDFVRAEADKLNINDTTWVAARLGDQFLTYDFDAEVDPVPPLKHYVVNGSAFSSRDRLITYERVVQLAGLRGMPTMVMHLGLQRRIVHPGMSLPLEDGMHFQVIHTGSA